jgi:hypothetical protein
MGETVVGQFDDETLAEAAAGHLRWQGLDARVRYRATIGVSRPLAPIRVVSPFGAYEVVVPDAQASDARDAFASIERSPRPRRHRWLGAFLVVVWLLPLLIGAVAAIRVLF